jgi:hypothetical protein
MQCINCGSQLEPNWTHCPHCGKFKSVLPEPVTDEAIDSIFGKMVGSTQGSKSYVGGPSSYGSGVRQQVFEVIVRQAIAGAPWREICAGPMQVNQITVEDIEAEVQRRRKTMMDPKSFKKKKEEKSKKDKDTKKDKDATKPFVHDGKPWGQPPAPPRPFFEKPETLNSATARLQKLYKQLDEFLENALKEKSQKEYSEKMLAELHDIIDAVMKLETMLYSIQTEMALKTDIERELKRTKKPIDPRDPEEPGHPHEPHRINW